MKTASAPLIALLASAKQLVMWDSYAITLIDTSVVTLDSRAQVVKRGPTRSTIGLEVSTLQVSVAAGPDTLIGSVPLAPFAHQGGFDGARLVLQRAFAGDHGVPAVGTLDMFAGRIGEVDVKGTEVLLPVHSDVELFDIAMPRNLYMSGCGHTLYLTGECDLSAGAFTDASTVAAGATRTVVPTALGTPALDFYALGVVEFTGGANAGTRRTIKASATNGTLTLALALPFVPAPGDTINVRPGCDRQYGTCGTKFGNQANNRGFDLIPVPEVTM